jgi:hypothetical protein
MKSDVWKTPNFADRRAFIGVSDARTVMGDDEAALVRLSPEKRAKAEPEDLPGNLIVQLGLVTEHQNRHCFEREPGQAVAEVQCRTEHPVLRPSAARHACDAKATLSTGPTRSPVAAAYTEFLAALADHPPGPIPVDADAIDLEQRVDHLNAVFGELHSYLAIILDDTAQNAPGGLDLTDAEAILADLASDLTGAIQRAADEMAGRVE